MGHSKFLNLLNYTRYLNSMSPIGIRIDSASDKSPSQTFAG